MNINENKYETLLANGQILFDCISGSQAYGTALPTSDVDRKFVYIASLEAVLSDSVEEQINVNKDFTGYEIGRYIDLVKSNNPNLLEFLAMPDDCVISIHPLFKKYVIDNAENFFSKRIRFSFGEYASSQIKKARGLNKKIVNPMPGPRKGLFDFCYVSKGQGSIPLKEYLKKKSMKVNLCGVAAIDHMKNCYHLFYSRDLGKGYKGITDKDNVQIILTSIEKEAKPKCTFYCNREGFQHYCKEYASYQTWIEERNPIRYQENMDNEAAYDGKNMSHCYRLLDMCTEILRDKKIEVRRSNREELLKIRSGEFEYEELLKGAAAKLEVIEELYQTSDLPKEISNEFAQNIILNIRKDFYNL